MKKKNIFAGIMALTIGCSAVSLISASAMSYTNSDIVNLQHFLLNDGKSNNATLDYDMNGDDKLNILDLSMIKQKVQNQSQESSKILVVYFSTPEIVDATTTASRVTVDGKVFGTTEYIATVIHENTNSDIFKIELEEPYDGTVATRAKEEHDNGILPALSSHIENFYEYGTIFVGYPTWWYDMPQVMYSFFDEYDFSGKTIIPFNSHGGSGFSGSIEEITELEPNATVLTNGLSISRGSVATAENDIIEWVNSLGYSAESAVTIDDYTYSISIVNNLVIAEKEADANEDSEIDSRDAVIVLKDYSNSLAGKGAILSAHLGDSNADGVVDSKDAVLILRYYANKLVS